MTPKYANRTCCNCGIRKPQPQMIKRQVEVEVGKSKAEVTGSTWFGAAVGDAASKRAIARAGFNSSQRTYTRKQTKWLCEDCANPVRSGIKKPLKVVTKTGDGSTTSAPWWAWLFWLFVICFILSLFGG